MIERIQDIRDTRLDYYSKLTDAQLMSYPQGSFGSFIAESRLVIERALKAGVKPISLFVEDRWYEQSLDLIERFEAIDAEIPVFRATHEQMQQLTGYQITRGALAAFYRPKPPGLDELLRDARRIAVLEDITNFTNIGAIFRSAAALGIDAVLVTPGCHDPLYKRAARVSMGTVFQVPWGRIGDVRDWADEGVRVLHEYGFELAAFALADDAVSIDDPHLRRIDKLAIVLGTEGDGLAASTIAACDYVVKIPMAHEVDSLNVAAASAVAFWELRAR